MKIRFIATAAAILSAASFTMPASAQVAGIATADPTMVVARAKALSQGYQQIETTFASNFQIIQQRSKEINDLNAQLDTNKDKNLTQAEMDIAIKAKSPIIGQLEQKENEIKKLQEPIVAAQVFVVDSIVRQYPAAQQSVITAKKINIILSPEAFIYAPDAVNVTTAIVAELDKLAPAVGITPPANWRPAQESATIYQQIQQLRVNAARAQAMQAAQQQQAQPQAGQPAAPVAPAPQPDSR